MKSYKLVYSQKMRLHGSFPVPEVTYRETLEVTFQASYSLIFIHTLDRIYFIGFKVKGKEERRMGAKCYYLFPHTHFHTPVHSLLTDRIVELEETIAISS